MKIVQIIFFTLSFLTLRSYAQEADKVGIWMKFERNFESSKEYENPLYDVEKFVVHFTSPTGKTKKINGFWDGNKNWKVRFAPDELGMWTYLSESSNESNTGLHQVKGNFESVENSSKHALFNKGSITHPMGEYHLTYADGSPFFWTACTAWNGGLKSTEAEWDIYLQDRVDNNYNVIQLVTTQWRGGDANIHGQVAFEGSGKITVNPQFFQHLDKKIDKINEYGLVAAPVLLWTLPFGAGRHLSPGYYLPHEEAILLAKYIVARYGGNQVVWFLGGDGRYINEYEQKWKNIGRGVFGEEHPGLVAQHPHGRSWIGSDYVEEEWLDIIGYQSSHSSEAPTVDWINKGPAAENWNKIAPRPIINLEPIYEEIRKTTTAKDVRNASYWSLFATPISGISYGANGIWPWLREGEKILNHGDAPWTSTWHKSLTLPGGIQIGYLSKFIQKFEWWNLKPAHKELLVEQPGNEIYNHFISVVKTDDYSTILAYIPVKSTFQLYNPLRIQYKSQWFNPVTNEYTEGKTLNNNGILELTSPEESDMVLILTNNTFEQDKEKSGNKGLKPEESGNSSNALMSKPSDNPPGGALAGEKSRLIVLSDIGSKVDPDDFQSMVHLLLYSNLLDIEGLIGSMTWRGDNMEAIEEIISAYEKDYNKLTSYSPEFPTPEYLRSVKKKGATQASDGGYCTEGTQGSDWIIERAHEDDPRPLWISVWGAITDVAQAVHDDPSIKEKIRVFSIGAWNTTQDQAARDYLYEHHSDLYWIESDDSFRGMWAGGDQSGDFSGEAFVKKHIKGHGALGDYYWDHRSAPPVTKNPKWNYYLREGDSPSWLYLIRGDINNPEKEHWGGQYKKTGHGPNYYTDHPDPKYQEIIEEKIYNGVKTVNKWRKEYLLELMKRMDWAEK